jgi:hypothetical protein
MKSGRYLDECIDTRGEMGLGIEAGKRKWRETGGEENLKT